jgi:aryl-alcohol dehydrogenase-like predicted oxidoreductase
LEYRTLGRTGIQVSNLCMGTMSFGGIADETESKAMFRRCLEVGINFFDTSNSYGNGESERILGRCIQGMRDDLVITSKVYGKTGPGVNDGGLSRRHIMLAVEDTLKRLGTDRLDFYFVHRFDSRPAMEEVLRAMDDLQRQGKILYPAASNWAAWQMAKALGVSAKEHLARFELIQPMYNLLKRQAEVEILPFAQSEQVGVISYSPLGGGLLTGKYEPGKKPEQGRLAESRNYQIRYGDAAYFDTAERFKQYATEHGLHPATLAVAWVMSHPGITAPILGARNVEQLEPSLAALNVAMTSDWRREISSLSVAPPPATDRSEENT